MPIDKEKCIVGMKVQDWYGNVGTVRWIGRMEKAQKPPNKDVGTYAAVEFEVANNKLIRTDGEWEGQRYCQSPPGTVEFHKPRVLDFEMNEAGVAAVRTKFGEKVAHLTDYEIIRFLIARKYDIPKVIEMMENNFKWRLEYAPSADEYFPPEMAEGYPVGFGDGVDREGNLLYFERPGNNGAMHPKNWVKQWTVPRIARWHACSMETGLEKLRTHPTARRVTVVIDLKNLGDTDKRVVDFGKAIAKIDQDNYPEHVCKMFIINASTMFTGIWRLIKIFIDDRTKAKISVLGKDYKEAVAQQVDPKYWPSFMDGSDDSWMSRGGIVGSSDKTKERDPETGARLVVEDSGVTDEQVAAAQSDPSPSSPSAAPADAAGSPVADTPQDAAADQEASP